MNEQFFHSIPLGSSLDILIIESSSVFAKLLAVYLRDMKDFEISVQSVRTYEDAKNLLLKDEFHVVILNLNLPDCRHEETFSHIHELIPDTAIIITTSSSDQSAAILAVKDGAQDFIYKSDINPVILRKTVLFAIDRQHLGNIAEEREKLLLSRLIERKKVMKPLNYRSWAEKVTRGLKRMNVGFPGKRNSDTLWEDFNRELRQSFLRHGLIVNEVSASDNHMAVESLEDMGGVADDTVETDGKSVCSIPTEILVAEDSPISRKICRMIGERMGLKMTFAKDGEQAVIALRDRMYDLVFMDIQMANMDGIEATRLIRSDFADEKQPKIVALTASDPTHYADLYEEIGMDGVIQKPISQEKIESIMRVLYPVER